MEKQKNKRFTVVLKQEVYNQLAEIAEEQGIGVSTVASQIISRNVMTQKRIAEALSNPETVLELTKALGLIENEKGK